MKTANKMSKEEFMAKVNETKKSKEEAKMKTKITKGSKETKKESKKINLEKPVLKRVIPEVKADGTLIKLKVSLEKAPKIEAKEEKVENLNSLEQEAIDSVAKMIENLNSSELKNELNLNLNSNSSESKSESKNEIKNDNVLEYDKASKIIQKHIQINQDLKIVETNNASGTSYFSGRTRLFKLIKSKRGISLEINVKLPKELCKEVTGMEDISVSTAHMKHLGTMKHHYRNSNSSELAKIIQAIMIAFKADKSNKEEAKAV